jgi:hypothetical protein
MVGALFTSFSSEIRGLKREIDALASLGEPACPTSESSETRRLADVPACSRRGRVEHVRPCIICMHLLQRLDECLLVSYTADCGVRNRRKSTDLFELGDFRLESLYLSPAVQWSILFVTTSVSSSSFYLCH